MSLTRSKTSPPDFILASSTDGAHAARHDPKAQRDRMTKFKRQLAANRTRGTEEVMKRRNRSMGVQQSAARPAAAALAAAAVAEAPELPAKDSYVTRTMVESLREERLAGLRGGGVGRGALDVDALQISAEDWPFVYFVVALDQMPVASEDMAEYKVGKPHTAKERQRFLAARKRRIQQSREEMERIRESNIDMGLRLEPIRPPTRTPYSMHTPGGGRRGGGMHGSRHPPTPTSSGSSQDFPMHRAGDYLLNNGHQMSMEDMMCRGFSQWFSDNFSTASNSQPGSRPGGEVVPPPGQESNDKKEDPGLPNKDSSAKAAVELPDIAAPELEKRKGRDSQPNSAPGSLYASANNNNNNNGNKKVHFAEGLPYIKGSGIPVPQSKLEKPRPDTTPYPSKTVTADEVGDVSQPPWSAPVMTSRSLPTMTPRAKNAKPMPVPKIDIVSEIYDELIVKTIQSFLAKEGYSEGKFANLRHTIMARLSATYPHLVRHKAWKVVRKDTGGDTLEPLGPITDPEERNRLRLRPLHQGFFAMDPMMGPAGGNMAREDAFLTQLQIPHGGRHAHEVLKPRWVPVLPTGRPTTTPLLDEDEDGGYSSSTFMAVDGRHIMFTPRDDLRLRAATLPGATSDYRMGPLALPQDNPRTPTWTHIIPSGVEE